MSLHVLLCLWMGIAGQAHQHGADQALLPPDGFLGHWKRAERTLVFTSSDLYGRIDGGAELFLEFGFEQLTVQNYSITSAGLQRDPHAGEFQLEIYRMADPIGATGVYLLKCGREARDTAFKERHTINNYQLQFKRGRYYVVINNTGGDEALRPGMVEFARFIAAHLPAEASTTIADSLPREGIIPDSIRLARGPYALQAVYTLGEGDILQLRRSITAVSADYRSAGHRTTLILVDYPDEKAAVEAFAHVQAHLDSYLTVEETGTQRMVFRDYAGEYGAISLSGRRMSVRVHLIEKPLQKQSRVRGRQQYQPVPNP
jgi:hypothetical protein